MIPLAEAVVRAEAALGEGRLAEAEALVEAIRRVVPEAIAGQRLWARMALARGEQETALRILARILEIDPEDAEAWAASAKIRREQGEREEARALLQVAWECAPWRRDLRALLATWCREDGLEGGLFPTAAALSAWYVRQGFWSRASEECRAVLERVGTRWDVRQRLAVALWHQGARREAVAEAERALEERPELVGAIVVAAWGARERGDESAARRFRELVWMLDPLGESLERWARAERWEETSWLREGEVVMVEEPLPGLAASEVALLWDLPSDEELEAARPSEAVGVEESAWSREEIDERLGSRASEAVLEEAGAGLTLGWLSEEEVEQARPRAELEPGWTGLLEELAESGVEPFEVEEAGQLAGERGEERRGVVEEAGSPVESETGEGVATAEPAVRMAEAGTGGDEVWRGVAIGHGAARETGVEERATIVPAEDEIGQARALLGSGRTSEAIRVIQRLVHRSAAGVEELVPDLERIVRERGEGAREAAMVLGAWYRRRGERGLAARYYELALRLGNE